MNTNFASCVTPLIVSRRILVDLEISMMTFYSAFGGIRNLILVSNE